MRADTICLLLLDHAADAERVGAALDPQATADHWHARLLGAVKGATGDIGRVRDTAVLDRFLVGSTQVRLLIEDAPDGNDVWTNELVAFAEELEDAGVPFAVRTADPNAHASWQERTPDGAVRYGSGSYHDPDIPFADLLHAVIDAADKGGDPWDVIRELRESLPRLAPMGRPLPVGTDIPDDLVGMVRRSDS